MDALGLQTLYGFISSAESISLCIFFLREKSLSASSTLLSFQRGVQKNVHAEEIIERCQSVGSGYFCIGLGRREDPSFIIEEKKKIVELFRPSDEVVKSVEALMVKHADTCYVGVHIRRGDYKDFFDGRFYYELPYYYSLMEQMYQLLHHTYRSVIFVICSNEQFDVTSPELLSTVTFSGENILRFEQAGAITDLYALSQCDYLLGPPSTFSQWASFYGNGKLCFVKNRHTVLHMDDFKVVERYESPFKEFRQYWKGKIL